MKIFAFSVLLRETESCLNPYSKNFKKISNAFYFSIVFREHCNTVAAHFNTILCAFRKAFGPDSDFLRQFLYFFNAENHDDFLALVQIGRLILQFVQESGNCYPAFGIVFTVRFYCILRFRQDFTHLSIRFY